MKAKEIGAENVESDVKKDTIVSPHESFAQYSQSTWKPGFRPDIISQMDVALLQHTAGNQAVQRLLQSRRANIGPVSANKISVVEPTISQRQQIEGKVFQGKFIPGETSTQPPHVVQRWARSDERVMAQLHHAELIDVFRVYAQEVASPTPNWPSRRIAIQQGIRDRLNLLARSGQADKIDDLAKQLMGIPDLTSTDDWLNRVLRHYRSRVAEEYVSSSDTASQLPSDPTLLAAAGAAVSAGTLSIAVYTAVPGTHGLREFRSAARSFAEDHRSLGVRNGRLISGEDAAMAATSTADVVNAVNNTLAQIRILLRRSDAKIDTLAFFAHGVNRSRSTGGRSYLNLGNDHEITNARQTGTKPNKDQLSAVDFVNQVTASLGDRARVVLYACELGDSFYGGEDDGKYSSWNATEKGQAHQGALDDELAVGDTSFADELRDLLNATGANREVWGHRTTGHTTANREWRHFGAGTQAGAENLFGEENARPGLTPQEGWEMKTDNIKRAHEVVTELIAALEASPNIPVNTLQTLTRRGKGLRGWIARELPFAPTPFVQGDPPVVRNEVVRFLERQAVDHEPPLR